MNVLVIDDEKNIRATIAVCLKGMGCTVTEAATAAAALTAVRQGHFDLVFLDLRLGDANGLELISPLLAERPLLAIVIITAYATIETAVEAVKRGVADYLPKPFTPVQIRHVVEQLRKQRQLAQRVIELEDRLREIMPEVELGTDSALMRQVLDTAQRAAGSDAAILLRGENGVGKGVLARALHAWSRRADHPLVTVNCAALSGELLAGELFGHAQGALAGAVQEQEGRVELAEGGTLFLDEVGEIPPGLQSKLLRFVQDRQFERLGDNRTRSVNVRLIAATSRDLEKEAAAGRFREELLLSINVIEIVLPPLRERLEDLLPLARRFLEFFALAGGRPTPELSPAAEAALLSYAWPGNIRELKNVMERAAIIWPSRRIEPQAFPARISGVPSVQPKVGAQFTMEEIEREHILGVIARTQTLEEAADILGLDISTLWRKRKKIQSGG